MSIESSPPDKGKAVGYDWQHRRMIMGRGQYETTYKYAIIQSMLHVAAALASNPEPYKEISTYAVAFDEYESAVQTVSSECN